MRLNQIFTPEANEAFQQIFSECQQFVTSTSSVPLLKNLPLSYNDVHKVKVRKRKTSSDFERTFNEAFDSEFNELRERAVFANGYRSLMQPDIDQEPFYVFPIDGFKFLYSTEVENSSQQYQNVFESIISHLDEDEADKTIHDLLKFTYRTQNLVEGINAGAEIILYNIPYYYAIRESFVDDYEELLSTYTGK